MDRSNDLPYKQEPDGKIVMLELQEAAVGTTREGNVTLYLRGAAPSLGRAGTYQCIMPPDFALEIRRMIAAAVAGTAHNESTRDEDSDSLNTSNTVNLSN